MPFNNSNFCREIRLETVVVFSYQTILRFYLSFTHKKNPQFFLIYSFPSSLVGVALLLQIPSIIFFLFYLRLRYVDLRSLGFIGFIAWLRVWWLSCGDSWFVYLIQASIVHYLHLHEKYNSIICCLLLGHRLMTITCSFKTTLTRSRNIWIQKWRINNCRL